MELDSHADTSVLGRNFIILSYSGKECEVSPYTDSYESTKHVPIVTGATAWTSPMDQETYILILNESLWMGDSMNHSLINPNQLRHYQIAVQDNPYSESPVLIHSPQDDFLMELSTSGNNIVAHTRTPTEQELKTCRHITLTSPHDWDPQNIVYPQPRFTVEEEIERQGTVGALLVGKLDCMLDNVSQSAATPIYNLDHIQQHLISTVKISSVPGVMEPQACQVQTLTETPSDVPSPWTFVSKQRQSTITPQQLSDKWFISTEQARATLKGTTQKLTQSALLPLGRCYKADCMFETP